MSDAWRVDEPSGSELTVRLRELLAEDLRAEFDECLSDYTFDGYASVCGVLSAFSVSFRSLIRRRDAGSIRETLAFVDGLLVQHRPENDAALLEGSVYNSLLACFFENVLPVRPEEFPVIGPYLGPGIRAFASRSEPRWLEPDPNTSPA